MVRVYNSLTKQMEEFKPLREKEVSMYVCGPTVYDRMHIGNSRPVVFFDTVARFFNYLGYEVTYVSNFTDIDDKIIARAREMGLSESAVSERHIKEIIETYRKLNCLPHAHNPRVTESIPEIIAFIALLEEKGCAYVSEGDVYFNVARCRDYGILSSQSLENLISGARVEESEKKRHSADFALWKKTEEGLNWDSPWGRGRPGWHTECVVMVDSFFKGKIDIHGGGTDLKFPHHDNEIAQALCAYDHTIANYWLHNGRIDLSGEKMSKSLGNVIWVDELLSETSHQAYRLLLLNVPYRQPLSYKDELLRQAENDYEKIKRAYNGLYRKLEEAGDGPSESDPEAEKIKAEFTAAMADDFNTANAITAIFKAVKLANRYVREKNPPLGRMRNLLEIFGGFLWVLGIETGVQPLTDEEKELIARYRAARREKNYELSDVLREEILARGLEL